MDAPDLLALVALACLPAFLVARRGRRRRTATRAAAAATAWTPVADDDRCAMAAALAPSVEAAERQLALVLGRLRAHLRDPGDVEASRIRGRDEFERCLDLAAELRGRVATLGGAALDEGPTARAALRRQILEGLRVLERQRGAGQGDGHRTAGPETVASRPASPRP